MNINSCTSNTRTDVNCAYNLDCSNRVKQNHVQSPCPAPEQPILNCDPNKPCPVYIRKDAPDLLYKRQFPDKPCPIIPGYRGSYKVCGLYTTELNKPKSNLKNHMKVVHHPKGSLYPGNGCGVEFLKNIDIAISSIGITAFEIASMGIPAVHVTSVKKEVETGANGTQSYVIKKGINKDKIATKDINGN